MSNLTHWQPYPWQEPIWQQWSQGLATGRMPHALLLNGAKGTGKSALAWLIAAQQLCEYKGALPCQTCTACQLLAAGSHPHVYDLGVLAENHKLTVELVREAAEFLTSTQVLSGPKIVIIPAAETLGAAAANALLKTLEEPLGHSLILLTTAFPGRVLPTIRSRCQQLVQHVTLTPDLTRWLQQRFELSEADVQRRWFWCEGSPLQLDPTLVPESTFDDFLTMGQSLQQGSPNALWALRRLTDRHDLNILIGWWQRWLVLFETPAVAVSVWPALSALLAQGLPLPARKRVVPMLDNLQKLAHELAAGFSMNAQLQFEALLYQWLESVA